ncbi:MAG TPA: hybrid sensor histidine kinase/response regulator [Lentisphaeria bacterium]|nr:MAG: hypothetical protein A2X45_09220 [Lentisphaerae bacterium GWF2_50_93]HCE42335.1 hybrid sensor histidine kinase/response regulator [Lentisphaeria bacterium]
MNKQMMRTICRVVLPYILFAGLWILLSDWLLTILIPEPTAHMQWSIYKGWAFVIVTALLLTALLRVEMWARERTEASLLRLAAAVDQSTETIIITDSNSTILYVNPAFEKRSGYSRNEAVGQNPRFLRSGKQDSEFYHKMREALAAGQVWKGHFNNKRKDGSFYEEESTISPVRDSAGRIVNYVAVNRDITREAQLENQLRQAQKMEIVGRLAGGVAHDFNNLLVAIIGYSEIALKSLAGDDPVRKDIQEVFNAGERAVALTRQLLAFSRKQILLPKVMDLNDLVANISKMLRRLISEDILLITTCDPALGRVKVDPGQIEQVITNLVVNARDAMPGGGTLAIQTANVELNEANAAEHEDVTPGRYVLLTLSDTGTGMTNEVKGHLFEPFFTTKEQGKGTGLGLPTVYGIVKQSGGHITVNSEVGKGTVFRIYLPRVDEASETPIQTGTPVDLPHGTETILLVEDEEQVRNLTRMVLEKCGYTVLVACNGPDAIKLARQNDKRIKLLLTDIIMPEMSGRSLAPQLLAMDPGIKVLYMSGYTDSEIIQKELMTTGTSFLQKPFSHEFLARKVREVLDAPAA